MLSGLELRTQLMQDQNLKFAKPRPACAVVLYKADLISMAGRSLICLSVSLIQQTNVFLCENPFKPFLLFFKGTQA